MPSNLAIDDELLGLAQHISGLKTKRETVNLALQEFVRRRKQEEIIGLFGTIEYDATYDYKELRKDK